MPDRKLDIGEELIPLIAAHLDVYKHHFELFLKGFVVYLAIVGTTAGFYFEAADGHKKIFFAGFIIVVCIIGMMAWITSHLWVRKFTRDLKSLYEDISVAPPPMFGAYWVTVCGMAGTLAIGLLFVILAANGL